MIPGDRALPDAGRNRVRPRARTPGELASYLAVTSARTGST